MDTPLVSVVITTKNEEDVLEELLKSLKRQTYRHVEIIVVDNHSTDRTLRIARRYTQWCYLKGPERSLQRNFGARNAHGAYLLFLDADMMVEPPVIEECVRLVHKKTDVKIVVIPERSVGTGFWAECKILERACYANDDTIEAARFFEARVFWEMGGYDERLTGPEDWDLPQKIKRKYRWERGTSFIIHRERNVTLSQLARKKYYYGLKVSRYVSQHPLSVTAGQLIYLLRPAFYRNWRLLLSNPINTGGMILMLAVEQFAGLAGFVKGRFLIK